MSVSLASVGLSLSPSLMWVCYPSACFTEDKEPVSEYVKN